MATAGDQLFNNKALSRLILPLVVEQLLGITIGMADILMVTSVGEAAVSGISLVDSINIILIQVLSALATGGAVISAQYIGCRDRDNACTAAKQLFYTTLVLSGAIMLLSLIFRNQILNAIFGAIEPDVMQCARTYFGLSALSYPFLAVYNSGAALFRSMGNSRVSMYTSLLMNILNISGNYCFIFIFKWGVAGAAIASLISRALAGIIVTVLLLRDRQIIFIRDPLNPDLRPDMIRKILVIGIPNGLENGMFNIGKLIVQSFMATYGTAAISANAIAFSIISFANVPGMASGLGLITVVGQCVGANRYDQAVSNTKKLVIINTCAMLVIDAGIFILAPALTGLFSLSAEAVQTALSLLRFITVAGWLFWPCAFLLPNALRAAGDARFTMLCSIVSMWLFRVGLGYILGGPLGMGVLGIWVAMLVDWIARAACFVARFCGQKWKTIHLI